MKDHCWQHWDKDRRSDGDSETCCVTTHYWRSLKVEWKRRKLLVDQVKSCRTGRRTTTKWTLCNWRENLTTEQTGINEQAPACLAEQLEKDGGGEKMGREGDEGQGLHASWKVLDFFSGFSRPWKVLENQLGPGKSWKWKLKVLESTGKWRSWIVDEFTGSLK